MRRPTPAPRQRPGRTRPWPGRVPRRGPPSPRTPTSSWSAPAPVVDGGFSPGPGRLCPVPGEDDLPAGEGLRRRAHPAGGEAADRYGDRCAQTAGSQQGPADLRRRSSPRARLARAGQLPRLRAGPAPYRLRRGPRPQAQKAGARLLEGVNVTGPSWTTAGRIIGVTVAHGAAGEQDALPRPGGGCGRREFARLSLAMGLHKRDDRPMGVAFRPTTRARGMTTTTWSPGWSCGTGRTCCPATAGSSAWATAPPTSAWACSTPARRSATWTTATCCAGGWPACRPSGVTSRRT